MLWSPRSLQFGSNLPPSYDAMVLVDQTPADSGGGAACHAWGVTARRGWGRQTSPGARQCGHHRPRVGDPGTRSSPTPAATQTDVLHATCRIALARSRPRPAYTGGPANEPTSSGRVP